jgi:hypothetical protein
VRRVLTVVVSLLAFVLTGAGPAAAETPFAVEELLTDRAGVLGTDSAEVQRVLEAVRDETGGSLHVVLVPTFDGATGSDWAEGVAAQSDLGSSYLLLAMAVEGNQYEWWLGDTFPYDVTEVDQLITAAAQPGVVAGDWSGAITALAQGLRSGEIPEGAEEAGGSRWSAGRTTAIVGGAALVLLAAHQLSRRTGARRTQSSDTEQQGMALDRRGRHRPTLGRAAPRTSGAAIGDAGDG